MKLKTIALSSALALVAISSANAAELSRKPFGQCRPLRFRT